MRSIIATKAKPTAPRNLEAESLLRLRNNLALWVHVKKFLRLTVKYAGWRLMSIKWNPSSWVGRWLLQTSHRTVVGTLKFKDLVQRIQNRTQSHMWIAGDFDYSDIAWPSRYIQSGSGYVTLHNNFVEILDDNWLGQVVEDETRLNNTLDLFLANNPSRINRVLVAPGISNHEAILVETCRQYCSSHQAESSSNTHVEERRLR